jgi:hypothetical protein
MKEENTMKKLLSLLSGMAIALSFGVALAEDNTTQTKDPGSVTIRDMIRDDDLPRINLDKDRATVNRVPAENGAGGSAAGGISGESDLFNELEQMKTPVEEVPAEQGTGAGGTSKAPEKAPGRYGY